MLPASNSDGTVGPGQIKYLELYTRGVNRSPKILDLRKCPNPIRNSVGHLIFSWKVFFGSLIIATFTLFSTLWAHGAQISERYCNVLTFISTDQWQSDNIWHAGNTFKCNEYWRIFGQFLDAKAFWTFLNISGKIWTLDWREYEKFPNLTLLGEAWVSPAIGKPGHPFPDQIMHTTCFYGRLFCLPIYQIDG